jgi:hypothetical protein
MIYEKIKIPAASCGVFGGNPKGSCSNQGQHQSEDTLFLNMFFLQEPTIKKNRYLIRDAASCGESDPPEIEKHKNNNLLI